MVQALRLTECGGRHDLTRQWGPRTIRLRWILFRKRSDFRRPNSWTRALCIRVPEVPRIVTEQDCHGCGFWEPADKCER